MKVFFSLLLAIVLLFSSFSCLGRPSATGTDEPTVPVMKSDTEPETSPSTLPQTKPETEEEPQAIEGFEELSELSCRQVGEKNWTRRSFAFGRDCNALYLPFPTDWYFERLNNFAYKITRGGKQIGTMGVSAPYNVLRNHIVDWIENDELHCEFKLCRVMREDTEFLNVFTTTYTCEGTDRLIYLNVDYVELDEDACRHILWEIALEPAVAPLPARADEPLSVMIFGNSFVRTSDIGNQLNHMIEESGEECTVDAVSVSGATMSYLAYNDQTMQNIKDIRSGKYNIVFQCGFYYDNDLDAFRTIRAACAESGTRLIIFPAFNERQPVLDKAFAAFPEVRVVNWRADIYALIDTGISQWDFCQNDAWLHSKPLAGYVGAHMIYRMLFGKTPLPVKAEQPLTMAYIKSILQDYPETGIVPGMKSSDYLLIDSMD